MRVMRVELKQDESERFEMGDTLFKIGKPSLGRFRKPEEHVKYHTILKMDGYFK